MIHCIKILYLGYDLMTSVRSLGSPMCTTTLSFELIFFLKNPFKPRTIFCNLHECTHHVYYGSLVQACHVIPRLLQALVMYCLCKLASKHNAPKSDLVIHIGDNFSGKLKWHNNLINIRKRGIYVWEETYNEHVTSPLSILMKPKPQSFQQVAHALLGGCLFWEPPCPYDMVFDVDVLQTLGILCSLHKVVWMVGCIFVLFYPNW